MGKGGRDRLTRALNSHAQTIHDTLQMLHQAAASSLEKVDWNRVMKLGDEISKQATVAGMLWSGEAPKAKELEENMGVYYNMLQGFLLLCHGSTVGAGPTLCASIRASAKQVTDCSHLLFKEAVSTYESRNPDQKLSIPQLAGSVWEACTALKKTPTTNCTAIGRAITQVAVSVKDVLREMKELKPGPTPDKTADMEHGPHDDDGTPDKADDMGNGSQDGDSSSEDDLGNDLSPEEMEIAQSTIDVISDILLVIKELIRFITSLLKQSNHQSDNSDIVDSLERLVKICQGIGLQVDELGACVYPPQEVSLMKATAEKIFNAVDGIRKEVRTIEGSPDGLLRACEGLEASWRRLESKLSCSDTDSVLELQRLAVTT